MTSIQDLQVFVLMDAVHIGERRPYSAQGFGLDRWESHTGRGFQELCISTQRRRVRAFYTPETPHRWESGAEFISMNGIEL